MSAPTKYILQHGAPLPRGAAGAVQRSIVKYGDTVSDNVIDELLKEFFSAVRSVVNPVQERRPGEDHTVTVGDTQASMRAKLFDVLDRFDAPEDLGPMLHLDFKIETAVNVMRGAARHVVQNHSDVRVDEYPALELLRVYDREVPRGFRTGKGGALMPVPDEDWPSRWHAAAEASGDEVALAVLQRTGRMAALKSSGIWQALGDGAGGYQDTLHNSYDPLAFNTGFRQRERSREDAEALGLLAKNETAKPAAIDYAQLISLSEAA